MCELIQTRDGDWLVKYELGGRIIYRTDDLDDACRFIKMEELEVKPWG